MPKKCFVPKCNSGYKTCKEKVSLFRVPNNETLLQQWQNAIAREDRAISRKDHVCEKHFQESDITRFWIYKDIKDKLKIPRLKKTAVPCIFPEKSPAPTDEETKPPKLPKPKKKKKPEEEENAIITFSVYESVETGEIINLDKASELFKQLWFSEVVVTVPSPSWAIHKAETGESKTIIISDVMITNNVPCYQKQIIMNDDETISIIIGTSIITQEDQTKFFGGPVVLESLEDLNILISTLHSLNFILTDDATESETCDMLN